MSENFPNIILLTADALRADHLSCYGYHRDTSPVLDKFAEDSLQYENAYSASSHTREAIPALLTGKYPDIAIGSDYKLVSETIASNLSDSGYATAGFHSNPFVSRAYGFDQGFDTFDDDLHLGQHKLIALAQRAFDKLRNRHYARADEINNRSLEWLDTISSDQPFFLWNHYMDTHGPYEPPGKYATLYTDRKLSAKKAQSLYQRAISNPDSITQDERQLLIDLYDAEIRYNDEQIGVFLDELQDRDLLSESIIIFSADHGDAFGEHDYYEHPRYLHKEITHVPLLVGLPDGPSQTVKTPVSTLDISTSIKGTLGSDSDFSLFNPQSKDRSVFLQARGEDENSDIRRYAIRTRNEVSFCERNVETGEITHDTASDSLLRSKLDSHVKDRVRAEKGKSPIQESKGSDDENVDEEIEQRLSALGYK